MLFSPTHLLILCLVPIPSIPSIYLVQSLLDQVSRGRGSARIAGGDNLAELKRGDLPDTILAPAELVELDPVVGHLRRPRHFRKLIRRLHICGSIWKVHADKRKILNIDLVGMPLATPSTRVKLKYTQYGFCGSGTGRKYNAGYSSVLVCLQGGMDDVKISMVFLINHTECIAVSLQMRSFHLGVFVSAERCEFVST